VFLSACGSSGNDAKPGPLDGVSVAGTAKAPTVSFKTKPLSVKTTATKVVTVGKGATLAKTNSVTFNYVLVNGKDGKQVESSFGKRTVGWDLSTTQRMGGLSKGLTGQHVGSRLLLAIPPADAFGAQGNTQAGFGPTDTVVFLIDLVSSSTPLTTAKGAVVPPKAGLPTATVDGARPATIVVPKIAAPTTLIAQPLIKGAGPVVKKGQRIKVNYTGVLWKNGKKFDASGDHGSSFDTPIGVKQVIPAWDKGLVGQTVGSRVLIIAPPAEAYGAKGATGIGPKDTLVFVVDILAAF